MGQFEKLVVLSVLLIVAVILAISLGSSGDGLPAPGGGDETVARTDLRELPAVTPRGDAGGEAQRRQPVGPRGARSTERELEPAATQDGFERVDPQPLAGGGEVGGGELGAIETGGVDTSGDAARGQDLAARADELLRARTEAPAESEGGLLLDASLGGEEELARHGAPAPKGSPLLGLADLEPTFDDELMEYTWRRGDTFTAVARRLYGDASYSDLLRLCNEGRTYVREGERVLVPVYDRRGAAHVATRSADEEPSGAVRWYEVEDGDSLWAISKKCYGSGAKWQRIFEANRDRLTSPDDVYAGLQLAIPE